MALTKADTAFDSVTEPLAFYQNVSPTKELRDASNEAESLVRDFGVEASMRLDVFEAKVAAEKNTKESGLWAKLSSEEQRLVEKSVYLSHVSKRMRLISTLSVDFGWNTSWTGPS